MCSPYRHTNITLPNLSPPDQHSPSNIPNTSNTTNHTLHLAQALSSASNRARSNPTPNPKACHQAALFLHNQSGLFITLSSILLVATYFICTMLAFAIDDLPDPEHPKAPHLSTELSTRGRKYHKKRLAIAAASCAIAWTAAYTTTRALQFSRLCSAADTNDVVLIIASVLAWGQLPLSTTAVVYLARDVWAGKRMADAQRLWGWRVYVLPVVVPVHVCLGVVKGLRALVGGYQWLEAFKKFFGAVDAGEAEEMLLPRYAEVIEAADGPERAAAGAWC